MASMLPMTKLRQNLWMIAGALFVLLVTGGNRQAVAGGHKGPKSLPANRWREIKRLDADSVQVAFQDTMFITIKRKDSFSYHNKDAFVYNGIYILDEKTLDFGYAKFTIVSKKPKNMLLHDAKGYYLLGLDSTDTVKTIVLPKEEKIDSGFTIDNMIGHWSVYKRTPLKSLSVIDHNTLLKSMLISGRSTGRKLGFIFSDVDKRDDPTWTIVKLDASHVMECEGMPKRTFKVTKCQGGEIILEDEEMQYYFKQYK